MTIEWDEEHVVFRVRLIVEYPSHQLRDATIEDLDRAGFCSKKEAERKNNELAERLADAGDCFQEERSETEKLRGELAAKDNRIDDDTATINRLRVELARADKAAFAAMADTDEAESRLATIAEKTAREQREACLLRLKRWGDNDAGLPQSIDDVIGQTPLVTDAPSKPEDKPWGTASRKGLHAKSPQEEDIESMQHIRGGLDAVIFEQNGHRWASDGVPKRFLCMNPGCAEKWVAEPPIRPMPLCAYSDPAPPPPEEPAAEGSDDWRHNGIDVRGMHFSPADVEALAEIVRIAWVEWAKAHPNPKPHWLVPWADLPESDRNADRYIGVFMMRRMGEWFADEALRQTDAIIRRLTAERDEAVRVALEKNKPAGMTPVNFSYGLLQGFDEFLRSVSLPLIPMPAWRKCCVTGKWLEPGMWVASESFPGPKRIALVHDGIYLEELDSTKNSYWSNGRAGHPNSHVLPGSPHLRIVGPSSNPPGTDITARVIQPGDWVDSTDPKKHPRMWPRQVKSVEKHLVEFADGGCSWAGVLRIVDAPKGTP